MKENYEVIKKITPLFDLPTKFNEIEDYLCDNSNLPGPRGNLTLAFKFADCFEKEVISKDLMDLLVGWINIPEEEAPTNNPREYLPFCGIIALGAHYCYTNDITKELIMKQFKIAMNDTRWRMREGAAMGFQKIAEKDFKVIKEYFDLWYPNSSYLEKRAFVAALAHPPILKDEEITKFSIKISDHILNAVLLCSKESRKSEEFTALSKGLQYALSVFTAYLPKDGFELFKKYALYKDPEINKIVKANLGKTRLTKKYAKNIEEVLVLMS